MAALLADTVVMLADGGVSVFPREAARERFARYFESVTFLEWSDLEPPAVRLARSGDLATVRVRRRVRLGTTDSAGRSRLEHTVFAWTETWVREGRGWGIVQVTSTERAGERDVAAVERRADVVAERAAGGGAGPGSDAGGDGSGPADPPVTATAAAPTPEQILARARDAVEDLPGASVDSVRAVSFVSAGSSPDGPFRTAVRSGRDGGISLAQRTSAGEVVRREAGPLGGAADRGGAPPSAAADRAFLQGHALLHLALDPAAVLGPPVRAGRMTFAGVPADVVVFRDGAGHPLELAHDRGTGRLLGGRLRNPADPGEVILLYLSGWRVADGLLLPRRAAYLQGDELYLHRLEEVRLNPPEGGSPAGTPGRP